MNEQRLTLVVPIGALLMVLIAVAAGPFAVAQSSQESETTPRAQEQSRDAQPFRFFDRVEMVSVPVAVSDKQGGFVTDLTVDDFKVYEDGIEQKIGRFVAGLKESWVDLPPELKEELSGRQVMGLILDCSGSMENDMRLIREAAIKFLTNIPKTEQLFILDFDENIRLSSYSSDDQRLISERIYETEAQGWTALYDAVATFLDRAYEYGGRKTLVVFSDGVDSRSMLGMGEVMDFVKASDVTIHSIHFGANSRPSASRRFQESRFLREIAAESGGSYSVGTSLEKLDEEYDRILEELYSQYLLGYVSSNEKRDGRYRKIKVEIDRKGIEFRARKGYLGPAADTEDEPR